MPGTYSQIYIHVVFAVKGRQNLISSNFQIQLNEYIAGIIKGKHNKPIIVDGMPDHIHAFIGFKPSDCLSDLVRDIKNNSSNFINLNKMVPGRFCWQEGYGAFSYSGADVRHVYNYIQNQQKYHERNTFRNEYENLLDTFKIEYDKRYLFEWIF